MVDYVMRVSEGARAVTI